MERPRVILDSNVLISSLLNPNSKASIIIKMWRNRNFDLILSKYIFNEVKQVLADKQLLNKYHIAKVKQGRLLSQLYHYTTIIDSYKSELLVRDPKDNPIIASALAGEADYLVTGDSDLLSLRKNMQIGKLIIIDPANFVQEFKNC